MHRRPVEVFANLGLARGGLVGGRAMVTQEVEQSRV